MILDIYRSIEAAALKKFKDLISDTEIISSPSGRARKLRINIFDGSYVDIWYSETKEYSYHWERRGIDNKVFRHDNAPHKKWQSVKTFPKHFHNGTDSKVVENYLSNNPLIAIEQFMNFIKTIIKK